jgi:hypothetical protein
MVLTIFISYGLCINEYIIIISGKDRHASDHDDDEDAGTTTGSIVGAIVGSISTGNDIYQAQQGEKCKPAV